jgi:hypothetical protein
MNRAALMGMGLAMAVMASPLVAQQATPDEQAAPMQAPPPPPASELPPPTPGTSTELPPPFPHYSARAPREHDPNYHRPTHARQHRELHRRGKTHHSGQTRHHRALRHPGKAHHHATHEHFSKRTIRQCHGMTYKQIMRHRNCRTMMKQDLEARQHRHRPAHHHSSAHRRKIHQRRR